MSRLSIFVLFSIPIRDNRPPQRGQRGYRTLYSKQDTQRCSKSNSRLICRTDKSDTQRSRRAASAFFSTHRKHSSRVLLHSADRELAWRPGCRRQTYKLSGRLRPLRHKLAVYRKTDRKKRENHLLSKRRCTSQKNNSTGRNANATQMSVGKELQKGQSTHQSNRGSSLPC